MSIRKEEMILFTFQEEMILFTFQEEMILLNLKPNHTQSIQISLRIIDFHTFYMRE